MAQAKKCSNPECDAEPATGRVAEPVGDNWFFNCSQCGFEIKPMKPPEDFEGW